MGALQVSAREVGGVEVDAKGRGHANEAEINGRVEWDTDSF
jgi:hypothetical protein